LKSNPLVSVIIPCWNQAHFVPEAIESLKSQTYPHWEAIIVNDGSPDDTRNVAIGLSEADPRIRYLEQPNRGPSSARNTGIGAARGEYLQFLDAEDVLLPEKLKSHVALLSTHVHGSAAAFSDYAYGKPDDGGDWSRTTLATPRFVSDNQRIELLCRWESSLVIPVHAFLFARQCFGPDGIMFDERLANHEDWDCWMRLSHSGCRFIKTDGSLVIYRMSPNSLSRQREAMLNGFEQAIEQLARLWANERTVVRLLKQKRRQVRRIYRADWRLRFLDFVAERRSFKRLVPWPLQVGLADLIKYAERDPLSSCWME